MADFTDVAAGPEAVPYAFTIGVSDQRDADFEDVVALVYSVAPDPDEAAPELQNFSPADGETLAKYDPVAFDITDLYEGDTVLTVQVSVYIISTDTTELAWNGDGWENQYSTSTRADISEGYTFTVRRRGGWPSGGVRVRVRAIDGAGNIGVLA